MKKLISLATMLLCYGALLFLLAPRGQAKPEYRQREGAKACTACHVKALPRKDTAELNPVGECYKQNGHSDLKGCESKDKKK